MGYRRLAKPGWLVLTSLLLVVAVAAAACGDDATPAPQATATPQPTPTPLDVSALTSELQKSIRDAVTGIDVPEAVSEGQIRQLIEGALGQVPEGLSAADVQSIVDNAVSASAAQAVTQADVARAIATAVAAAAAAAAEPLTAAEIRALVADAVERSVGEAVAKAIPTAAPTQVMTKDAGLMIRPSESNPKYGGTLKWGGLSSSTFYDLHQTASIANMGPQAPMYDLLVQVDPVNWDAIIPDLATHWEISNDFLTYTFSLREGVKFHDGAALHARDVAASFNHIIFPPAGVLSPRKGLFGAVDEVIATDNTTVEFRLARPSGFLMNAIAAGQNAIMREKSLEDNDFDLRRIPDYPGTGPFRFVSLEPDVVWKLERNPDYYNPELPYLDGLDVFHVALGPATGAACLANTIDFCFFIDPDSWRRTADVSGLEAAGIFPTFMISVMYNFDSSHPFSDVRVRKAIDLVLDKPAMVDVSGDIQAGKRVGWLALTDPLFDEYWAQAKDQPGWRTPTAADIVEAQALMSDAGLEGGLSGVDFMVRDLAHLNLWAPIIQDVLKRQLNIEIDIRQVTTGVYVEDLGRGTFDMTYGLLNANLGHVGDYWSNWYLTDGGFNLYGYSNPNFDAIANAAAQESDPARLRDLVFQGIAILDEDVPTSVFSSQAVLNGWWDYVKGHQMTTKGPVYWEGMKNATWWLDR
jgi:ABC-type transport system substrate-binding protein